MPIQPNYKSSNSHEVSSPGIEKLLKKYSIDDIAGKLAQVQIGKQAFFPRVDPLTDYQVLHRRDVLNEEYFNFLEITQNNFSSIQRPTSRRIEREVITSLDIAINELSFSNNTKSSARYTGIKRPEREFFSTNSPPSTFVVRWLTQNSIEILESANSNRISLESEYRLDAVDGLAELDEDELNGLQITSGFLLNKSELFDIATNADSEDYSDEQVSFDDALSSLRDAYSKAKDVFSNREERLPASSNQLNIPKRLTDKDISENTTRAYVDLNKKEITVVKPGEQPIVCKLAVNPKKLTPEGNYGIRSQGVEQNSIYNLRTWYPPNLRDNAGMIIAELTGGLINEESLRSNWYLLEPQFDTNSTRLSLHPGQTSLKCVTVTDNQCYATLAEVLNTSETFFGYGTNGLATENASGQEVEFVAYLTVSNGGEQAEVVRASKTTFSESSVYSLDLELNQYQQPRRNYDLGGDFKERSYRDRVRSYTLRENEPRRDAGSRYNLNLNIKTPSIKESDYSPELFKSPKKQTTGHNAKQPEKKKPKEKKSKESRKTRKEISERRKDPEDRKTVKPEPRTGRYPGPI